MSLVILVRADATGKLILDVNGNPSNGRSTAKRKEDVQWIVQGGSDLEYIDDIQWKNISGSENLFSENPPTAEINGPNINKRHWKGTVNDSAPDYSVYVYNIFWKKRDVTEIQKFDPIISIKPTTGFIETVLFMAAAVATAAVAFLAFKFLFKKLKK
jgi:hypothetical protein